MIMWRSHNGHEAPVSLFVFIKSVNMWMGFGIKLNSVCVFWVCVVWSGQTWFLLPQFMFLWVFLAVCQQLEMQMKLLLLLFLHFLLRSLSSCGLFLFSSHPTFIFTSSLLYSSAVSDLLCVFASAWMWRDEVTGGQSSVFLPSSQVDKQMWTDLD